MKLVRWVVAAGLATFSLLAGDVTGKWTAEMQGPNGNTRTVTMNLKADGSKLTGTVSGGRGGDAEISDGKVDGNDVSFSVVREFNGNKMTIKFMGKVDGDTIKGKSEIEREGETRTRDWEAKRSKD